MKSTTSILTLSTAVLVAMSVAYGCSDDDDNGSTATPPAVDSGGGTSSGTSGTPGTDGSQAPAPPALGAQIDRFGRPAINTALIGTFDEDAGVAGMKKDAYNANAVAASWVAASKAEIARNLGVLDSLDSVCGNQILADLDAGADRYGTLAGVLADDRQWLNTASTTCTTYLAVELNATGKIPNTDCGGRKLSYDVIDVTYSALAVGAPTGVTDGIAAVPAKVAAAAFPYLAEPL